MQIRRFGRCLLFGAWSLALAAPAFAQVEFLRLDGSFSFEQDGTTDLNRACVVASNVEFQVYGGVNGTSGACSVVIDYSTSYPNKASASVLKDDGSGTAKVSEQIQTGVAVLVSGAECATPFGSFAFAEKCKVSGSVKATEGFGSPDTVEQGRISLTCDLGENGTEFDADPTPEQLEAIVAAFADRKDVKFSSNGKLTIKTKGVRDDGDGCG